MRQLYITCGIPGSGKSTFIRDNHLEAYTISSDNIRLLVGSPVLNNEAKLVMPFKDDGYIWELLYQILERRMTEGELTIIDATHVEAIYLKNYIDLAKKYRYKLFVIDFSKVPLDICKANNKKRINYKIVDDSVLDKMYSRLQKLIIPSEYTVLKPEEINITIENNVIDLTKYSRIHHIGDIQGCFIPLKKYFDLAPFSSDEYYIFVGDLLDRGNENGQVLQYLCESFVNKPNVSFIEGNHELYLWQWLTNQPITSKDFIDKTREQIEAINIDKSLIRGLFNNMYECLYYTYNDKKVFVTHAGISNIPDKIKFLSSQQYISGTGQRTDIDVISDTFATNTDSYTYQIHGHRNRQNYPIRYNDRVFNLEGKVDKGGELRIVQLDSYGFNTIEISNHL